MPLPGALTLTTLSGTYTSPDGTPLGGQLTFTPSSALTNGSGHPVLAATPLTVRLQPGTGAFSIDLLNTDNDGLLPDTWMWHVIVSVAGAQEAYFFGLPSTLGPATDINALTPVSPPPSGATFVSSINGQTGAVELGDGFGVLPPAGDLGGTTLSPQVTATHLAAPLPVVQGGTGAASGTAALTALGGASAATVTAETTRATAAEALLAPKASPALTGTPTAPTATALTSSTVVATTAYADSAVAVEAARAATAEGLKAAKASNLSDLSSAATARTNLAVPGLATANTMTADQYFKSGRPWFDVVAFGADPTGAADSTSAFTAAIAAATGGDVTFPPATTTRVAKGGVWIPAGTYKVTSDVIIRSVAGFALKGAGAGVTTIRASGAGFTTAAVLIDGSLDGVYEGFKVSGDGTEGTAGTGSGGGIPDAIRLDWTTAAQRSTSANTFRNIRVTTMKYVVGLSLEGNGSRQLDGTSLHDVVITGQQTGGSWSSSGSWQKGIAFGSGTYGNNYDHVLYNCSVAACFYGVYCNASGFELYGSQPASNAVDFFLNPGVQTTINGVQSQGAGQFIVGSGGSAVVLVSVRDVQMFTGSLVSSGKWVATAGSGASWVFENVQCYTAGAGGIGGTGVPLMQFDGLGAKENVTLINVQQAAPPSTGVALTSGGSLICIGYVQMTSTTVSTVGTLFPLYCLNAGALYQQGTAAARPAAATFGEMFYYATDTGALSHSSGSAWTAVTGAAATAPDVQVFAAGGTWTKPSAPAPVTTDVVLITPGGGGGSGRRGAASTVRCGGGGGAGGSVTRRLFSSADLTSTVTVTVAGQQSGGAAVTADDTNGNAGAGFATCSFGAFITGFGGQGGQGGTNASGAGGASALGGTGVSGAGVSASTVGGAGVLANLAVFTAPGGPSGGGITSGNVAGAGAAGASSSLGTVGTSTGGAVDSTAPTAGAGANAKGAVGVSCGSGAASITTAAQQGADAAATAYGVGGAGGGASLDGSNSGAGGKGGGGYCVAVSYFQ